MSKGICTNRPKICETHPQFIDWMYDKEDSKRYSYGTSTKIDWICPYCGSKVEKIRFWKTDKSLIYNMEKHPIRLRIG